MAMKRSSRCDICGDVKKPKKKFDVAGTETILCLQCEHIVDLSRNTLLWRAKLLLTVQGIAKYLYGDEE